MPCHPDRVRRNAYDRLLVAKVDTIKGAEQRMHERLMARMPLADVERLWQREAWALLEQRTGEEPI